MGSPALQAYPARQRGQLPAPATLNVPGPHSEHVEEPAAEYCPAGHCVWLGAPDATPHT